PSRRLEDGEDRRLSLDLKETGPPRGRPRGRSGAQQNAQFRDLLRRMVSQVLNERRLFGYRDHLGALPPHSAYRCPHWLRRIKIQNVSSDATFFFSRCWRFRNTVLAPTYSLL